MNKHHAAEDEPQSSDMSWIVGLAPPADTSDPGRPVAPAGYYDSLVARTPRHAAPADGDEVEVDQPVHPAVVDGVAASARTGPLRRISAEQIDTLIGRLDGVEPAPDAAEMSAEPDEAEMSAEPDDGQASSAHSAELKGQDEPVDVGLSLFDLTNNGPVGSAGSVGTQEAVHQVAAPPTDTASVRRTTPRRGPLHKPVLLGAAAALCLLSVGGGTMAGGTSAGGISAGGISAGGISAGANVAGAKVGSASASGGITTVGKTVTIVIDGQIERVNTASSTVAGALTSAGLTSTSHDSLAPGAGVSISDGATIVLNRGRLLTLTVDGQQRQIWTTARTVDEALVQLGPRTAGWSMSANRSRAIPLAGLAVSAATLHTVALSVEGRAAQTSATTADTVRDLLTQHKITLGPLDTVAPARGTTLSDGLVVTVDRMVVRSSTTTVAVPVPASTTVTDASMAKGTSKITQQGRPGSELVTSRVTSFNGMQIARTQLSRRTVVAPVGTITHIGTKSGFTYVGGEVFTNDTSFGVNWDGLAMCESTHNPAAVNDNPVAGLPTYGMFQFDLPTWASVGGSGNPVDASPEEQLMRAKILFQQRGLEPWACRDAAH